jgi:hypothetical protein
MKGLDVARRVGWREDRDYWRLGQIYRVYYVSKGERPADEHEPDEFHRGIAPSVKLLHSTVSRIAELKPDLATGYLLRWRALDSSVHLRLWAAMARDPRLASGKEVAELLLAMNDRLFWNQNVNPEIAELRAIRFKDFDPEDQKQVIARIRKMPPCNQWRKKSEKARVEKGRLFWALRELRRIEIAGGELRPPDKVWFDKHISQFPELSIMERPDEGFMGIQRARWVAPNPDTRFDLLSGEARLQALQTALLTSTAAGGDCGTDLD